LRFSIKYGDPATIRAGCAFVPVFSGGIPGKTTKALDKASGGRLSALYAKGDFSGKAGTTLVVDTGTVLPCQRVLLVGCGPADGFDRRAYRQATEAAIKAWKSTARADAVSFLGQEVVGELDGYRVARIAAESWHKVSYSYTRTRSEKKSTGRQRALAVALPDGRQARPARRGLKHGDAIGAGSSFARELGNLPASTCTPSFLASEARRLAKKADKLTTQVLNEAQMRKLGMGSLLSVTDGTAEPAKLIVMKYRGAAAATPPTVLIGKGITFDSGGISLKPGPGMDEMKFDMCGAATVFGAMHAAVALNLEINLTVVVPACENLPGSRATKPGDVVKSMSGQTIEILNTDAEGRLILCDAITYARRFKPSSIVDVATLTGACVIALGKHRSGLLSNSDILADALLEAGEDADDVAWRLPMDESYMDQLRSNFADVANVGGREAGTITAGCFLSRFAEGVDWAHLDIAGTAWRGGKQKGSTGRPVPLLTEFLLAL
jgi:leucyl aminopeptidase